MADPQGSIGDALKDVIHDLQEMVRAEVRLARAEVREELGKARQGAVLLTVAGVASLLALSLVLLAAVFALATIWPLWAAALVVGGATALVGGTLGSVGVHRLRTIRMAPEKTIQTVKENIQWAKTRTK